MQSESSPQPGKDRPPRIQKPQPARKNVPRNGESLGAVLSNGTAAIHAFRNACETLMPKPSGTRTFEVRVSHDPDKWFCKSTESSTEKRGPKTPREILDPDCAPIYQNRILLTNVHIEACISWTWENELWREKWLDSAFEQKEELIVLGEEIVPPADPAEYSSRLKCSLYLGKYTCIEATRFYHTLGQHRIIAESPESQALVNLIVFKSKQRMHGKPGISPEEWANAYMQTVSNNMNVPSNIFPSNIFRA